MFVVFCLSFVACRLLTVVVCYCFFCLVAFAMFRVSGFLFLALSVLCLAFCDSVWYFGVCCSARVVRCVLCVVCRLLFIAWRLLC